MFHHLTPRAVAGLVLMMGLVAPTLPAAAATAPPSAGKKSPTSVRFIDAPSSESPAARRARLKKECKGRPNAGACLGMTGRD